MYRMRHSVWLATTRESAFGFLSNAANNGYVNAPRLVFIPIEDDYTMYKGRIFTYKMRIRGIPIRWYSEIVSWNPGHNFADTQHGGPFAAWHHEHLFTDEAGGVRVTDTIDYKMPLGILGRFGHWLIVRRELEAVMLCRSNNIHHALDNK